MRIAVGLVALPKDSVAARDPRPTRVVVMDLDGGRRSEILIPDGGLTFMPDWR
jgi:hypothetical protein